MENKNTRKTYVRKKNTVHITSTHKTTKTFHFTKAQKKFAVQKACFHIIIHVTYCSYVINC